MPSFQFQSNLPIILLIIVIALISLYFFLDIKKVKLVNEELEKKNDMVIKEIDNIHLRLHKFFSGMPKGIVQQTEISGEPNRRVKLEANTENPENTENTENTENPELEDSIDKTPLYNGENPNTQSVPEISENEFDNIKKSTSNNIFGEIISNNDINQENSFVKEEGDKIDDNTSITGSPFDYSENVILGDDYSDDEDNKEDNEEDDDEGEDEEEDDEVDDINSEDHTISGDLDECNKYGTYMKYSVKELKDKCVEMNLKHSGNKSTLAKRIADNYDNYYN